jgi:hypothetical protein
LDEALDLTADLCTALFLHQNHVVQLSFKHAMSSLKEGSIMRKSNRETRTPAMVDNWVSRRLSLQRLRTLNEDNTDRKLKLVSVLTEMERSVKHLA